MTVYGMGDEPWHDAPWMPLALAELGQREVPGDADNPRIVEYHSYTAGRARTPDAVPWCSSFANFCMRRAGERCAGSKAARSWLKWGVPCEYRLGAVVVFWRKARNSPSGHVAFVVGETADSVLCLGGNQSNAVCVKPYPKRRLLGYRWPR